MSLNVNQAEKCLVSAYLTYDVNSSVESFLENAGENAKRIRSCYNNLPTDRSERLRKELTEAQSSLQLNTGYRLLTEDVQSDKLEQLESSILGKKQDTVDWIAKGIMGLAMGIWTIASLIGLRAFMVAPADMGYPGDSPPTA